MYMYVSGHVHMSPALRKLALIISTQNYLAYRNKKTITHMQPIPLCNHSVSYSSKVPTAFFESRQCNYRDHIPCKTLATRHVRQHWRSSQLNTNLLLHGYEGCYGTVVSSQLRAVPFLLSLSDCRLIHLKRDEAVSINRTRKYSTTSCSGIRERYT